MKDKQKFYAIVKAYLNYKPVIVESEDEHEALEVINKNKDKLEIDQDEIEIMWEDIELVNEKDDLFNFYQETAPAKCLRTSKNKKETNNISKAVLRRACDGMIDWASDERTEEGLSDSNIEYYSGYINAIEDVLYAIDHEGEWQDKEFLERCKEEELRSKK